MGAFMEDLSHSSKHAAIDDGLFDVVVFKRLGYLEINQVSTGRGVSARIFAPPRLNTFNPDLRVTSEQNVPVELDGELAGSCPVDFQIREGAVRVLAPATSS